MRSPSSSSLHRRARAIALALTGSVALACTSTGRAPLPPRGAGADAPPPPTAAESSPAAAGLAALSHLLELPGLAVPAIYTPGALDRAAHLQLRAEAMAETYYLVTRRPAPFVLWVLDREDWERAGLERSYGLPQQVDAGSFALPAAGDAALVETIAELIGGAPEPGADLPLRGTAEEAAALAVSDLLFQVEATRDFALGIGLVGEEPWITALLAHVLARLAFERHEPGRMPEIAALYDAIAEAHGGLAARPLAGFREGLPLEVDLWYQAQLLRGADVVWVKGGELGAKRWLSWLLREGATVSAAQLEKRYPGLAAWRAESFSP